jgi:uncharacterized membrane protein HdeD (DUF308 family)
MRGSGYKSQAPSVSVAAGSMRQLLPSWQMLTVRGLLAVVFGVVAMTWRVETAAVLVVVWGVWAVCDGIALLAQAFTGRAEGARWLAAGVGLVAVLAGLLAIARPGMAAVTLTWLLGIWAIARAGLEALGARHVSGGPRWLLLAGAGLSMLIGVLFVANPGEAAVALTFLLGLTAVVWGVVYLINGFTVRRELQSTDSGDPLPA